MRPAVRRLGVTAHLSFSVGWLGADAAFLALAIVGLASGNAERVRAAYVAMDLVGRLVIVPLGFVALLSGLVLALATPWGLFRHYWILAKFFLTTTATLVLLLHVRAIEEGANRVFPLAGAPLSVIRSHLQASGAGGHLGNVQLQLAVAAGAGLVLLLGVAALGVFKPRGLTPYGRRKQKESLQKQGPGLPPVRP